MSKTAAPPAGPLRLEAAFKEAVKDLDNEDLPQVAAACAAVVLLSARLEDKDNEDLAHATPKLVALLSCQDEAVQVSEPLLPKHMTRQLLGEQRSCYVQLNNSLTLWTAEKCVCCLDGPRHKQPRKLAGSSVTGRGEAKAAVSVAKDTAHTDLKLNCINLLGAVAEGGESGAHAVLQAGGAEVVFGVLDGKVEEEVQEAGADTLCKLAIHTTMRPELARLGAIEKLAAMLGSRSKEVVVRTLLALGMLLGQSVEDQKRLASSPGAVQSLADLMRQQEDEDCRQIARGLFTTLSRNSEVKADMAAALKAQMPSQDAA